MGELGAALGRRIMLGDGELGAQLGRRAHRCCSSGPSSTSCSTGVDSLEPDRFRLRRSTSGSRNRDGGGRCRPASAVTGCCPATSPAPAPAPVSASLSVCSERSTRASCAVNHDCFLTTPLGREGLEPIVGGFTVWWNPPPAPPRPRGSFALSPRFVEPGTSRLRRGFMVMMQAQTMLVLISTRDQKSVAMLLWVKSVSCWMVASSVRRMMETTQMLYAVSACGSLSVVSVNAGEALTRTRTRTALTA